MSTHTLDEIIGLAKKHGAFTPPLYQYDESLLFGPAQLQAFAADLTPAPTAEYADLEAMYFSQCRTSDEFMEALRESKEAVADATLTARIAELEQQLGKVNQRLADANTALEAKEKT